MADAKPPTTAAAPSNNEIEKNPLKTDVDEKKPDDKNAARLLLQLNNQFVKSGEKFYFKTQNDKEKPSVAFEQKDGKIVTKSNDEKVAGAMAKMAEANQWNSIRVTGNNNFKRAVWLEASQRGIEVVGFKPNEKDLVRLAQLAPDKASKLEKQPASGSQQAKSAIVETVAKTMLKASKLSAEEQKKVMDKIAVKLQKRVLEGNVPAIPVYDKNAPSKAPSTDRARPLVERDTQRER